MKISLRIPKVEKKLIKKNIQIKNCILFWLLKKVKVIFNILNHLNLLNSFENSLDLLILNTSRKSFQLIKKK